jgi:hypothetical protein
MTTRKIFALSGFAGAGKDTLGHVLVNRYGYKRMSFASSLKDCISSITGWDREKLEGTSLEDREWRERKDEWWSERLGRKITPRIFMTLFGTDVVRKEFPNLWLLSLERQLSLDISSNIVITDCRFQNEIEILKNINQTYHIHVSRESPSWSLEECPSPPLYIHQSEYEWLIDVNGSKRKFDYIFENIYDKESPNFERSIERMMRVL